MADLNRGPLNPANVASRCGHARMSTISEGQGRKLTYLAQPVKVAEIKSGSESSAHTYRK
jgi:hypothetical protein